MRMLGTKYWTQRTCSTILLGCGLIGSGLIGCGQAPEAVFTLNAPTNVLMTSAKGAVASALLEDFGTPHKLVA